MQNAASHSGMLLLDVGSQVSDENVILISISVESNFGRLVRETWDVEVNCDAQAVDVKQAIKAKYGIDTALQRISLDAIAENPGVKDILRVEYFPDGAPTSERPGMRVKTVFLLPKIGMDKKFAEALANYHSRQNAAATGTSNPSAKSGIWGMTSSLMSRPTSFWGEVQRKRHAVNRANTKPGEETDEAEGDIIIPLSERFRFNAVASFVCLLNMLTVGFSADYTCWGKPNCKAGDYPNFYILDCLFAFAFIVEIAARMVSLGPIIYFLGDPLSHPSGVNAFNCIDILIVFARAVDTFILQGQSGTRIKIISCFRVMHIINVTKNLRLVKSLRELWLIISGMAEMFKAVVWVMLLLVIILWVFGILLTIAIGHSDEFFNYSASEWDKDAYFGTVPKSAYSLFQIMTFDKWSSSLIRPVFEVYPWIFVIIVPFMCIATIGLLNIIVGVVVETTLMSATSNEEREAKELQKMHAKVMESLKVVFDEADTDGGGMLDREELRRALKKPTVRGRMQLLDIPPKDLDMLFDTLDEGGTGEIKTEQFFRGCSRLRGPALACDMHRMSVDFSRYITRTDSLVELSKLTNEKLDALLTDIESVDRDIVRGIIDNVDPILKARRMRLIKRATSPKKKSYQERRMDGSAAVSPPGGERRVRRPSIMEATIAGAMGELGFNPNTYRSDLRRPGNEPQTMFVSSTDDEQALAQRHPRFKDQGAEY
mmetsp:Transcript_57781/g.89893  ORF Transcript_57781/g.89893 Transcript_57781/m.89893 type:complete len:713 (-) Transcript_57781:22-2160(-)